MTHEPPPPAKSKQKSFDPRVLAGLLLVNVLVHFVPFERPGFEQDDYFWLHLSRQWPPGDFVFVGLSQGVRPLGSTLFMLVPQALGLHEGTQLALLIASTSLLTALGYAVLSGPFSKHAATLAGFFFVIWPVKHEIYGDQLIVVNTVAACLVLAAGLLYRRWANGASGWPLIASAICYLLSILTYEIGFLAPLVFLMADRPVRSRALAAAAFLIPAGLYFLLRLSQPPFVITTGHHGLSLDGLAKGMLSLPSNLMGFQLARNVAYGLWGVWQSPVWFAGFAVVSAALAAGAAITLTRRAKSEATLTGWRGRALGSIAGAFLLAGPAAFVLVESRHSVLAALGMAAFLTTVALRAPAAVGASSAVVLLMASQGLALRQAEVSTIQASVYDHIGARAESIRSASTVVFDVGSLARRFPYTWGDRSTNVLKSYWGLPALSGGALKYMIEAALPPADRGITRRMALCVGNVAATEDRITCDRSATNQRPFSLRRKGVVTIDFATIALPATIQASAPIEPSRH